MHGSSRWDEPWLTEHQLAGALARRTGVLFVDPPQSIATPLRRRQGGGTVRRMLGLLRPGLDADRGAHVVHPVMLPPVSSPRARELSSGALRRQVDAGARAAGLTPGLVVTARELYERVPGAPAPFTVMLEKDWTRAGGHLTGVGQEAVQASQLRTWAKADLVCATSTRLRDRIAQDGVDVELLRHGFDTSVVPLHDGVQPVPELADLPRPLLGGVGRLDGRWAFPALADLAAAFPDGSVLLVGPVSPLTPSTEIDAVLALPNVHHFPSVTAKELPNWLGAFDCCLIPYKDDEWQRYASPLKIWDYLYAGNPIAATGSPAMGEFPAGLVAFAQDHMELSRVVRAALAANSPERARARKAHALANSWDDRVDRLLELVGRRAARADLSRPDRARVGG